MEGSLGEFARGSPKGAKSDAGAALKEGLTGGPVFVASMSGRRSTVETLFLQARSAL